MNLKMEHLIYDVLGLNSFGGWGGLEHHLTLDLINPIHKHMIVTNKMTLELDLKILDTLSEHLLSAFQS